MIKLPCCGVILSSKTGQTHKKKQLMPICYMIMQFNLCLPLPINKEISNVKWIRFVWKASAWWALKQIISAYFPAQQTVIEVLVRVRGAMHETRDHACLPRCTAHSNQRPITPYVDISDFMVKWNQCELPFWLNHLMKIYMNYMESRFL